MCEDSASIVAGETSAKKEISHTAPFSPVFTPRCAAQSTAKADALLHSQRGGKRRTDLEVGVIGACDAAKGRFPVLME